jgi:hypothetical protein
MKKPISDLKDFITEYDKLSKEYNSIVKNIPVQVTLSEEYDGIIFLLSELDKKVTVLSNLSRVSLEPAKLVDFQVVISALDIMIMQKLIEVQRSQYVFDMSRLREAIERLEIKVSQ